MLTDPLPLEVCRRIVEHLQPMYDNPELAAVARTSRALQPIAERILYHSLYLLGLQIVPALLESFGARGSLASYPRIIYVHPLERRGDRTTETYWTQLGELLLWAAAGIELLCVAAPDADAAWVLRSLRSARSRLAVLRVPFVWDTELAGFLESPGAQGLTRVELGDAPAVPVTQLLLSPVALHAGAVPHLGTVEAPVAALCVLVPGRPVTHVRVRVGAGMALLHMLPPASYLVGECLVRSAAAGGVVALDVGDLTHTHRGETYSLEVMELAPQFLPNLEFLGRVNFPWTTDMPMSRLYRPLIRLVQLRVLELIVSRLQPSVDTYWQLATASELRTFSASLRELVFWKGHERHRWVYLESDADFVLTPQEDYLPWGGV